MKLHRFYIADKFELDHSVWINDEDFLHQWVKVLRFQPGSQVVLFNDRKEERLYKIDKIDDKAAHLELVTEMSSKTPKREVYLCFSLLKKDKNDWVLQKATELGVRHLVPIMSSRTEKTGFKLERAQKIAIEAAEQCGRADIPGVREPITIDTAINELSQKARLLVAEQGSDKIDLKDQEAVAIFIGPEGGWSDDEKNKFVESNIEHMDLSPFTLRAETASIVAATLLC